MKWAGFGRASYFVFSKQAQLQYLVRPYDLISVLGTW